MADLKETAAVLQTPVFSHSRSLFVDLGAAPTLSCPPFPIYINGLRSLGSISLTGLPDDHGVRPTSDRPQSKLSAVALRVADLVELDIVVPTFASVWKPETVMGSPKKRVPSGQRVGRRFVQTGRAPPSNGVGMKRKAGEMAEEVEDEDEDETESRALTNSPVTDLVLRLPPPVFPATTQTARPISGGGNTRATFTDSDIRDARNGKRPERPSPALAAPGPASNFASTPQLPRKPQRALTITAQSVLITQKARIAQLVHDPAFRPPRPNRIEQTPDDAPPPYIRYLPRIEQQQQSRPPTPGLRLRARSASPVVQQTEANTAANDFDIVTDAYTAFLQEQEDDDEDWNTYHARRFNMSWDPYRLEMENGRVNPILAVDVAYNGYSEAEWEWQEGRRV